MHDPRPRRAMCAVFGDEMLAAAMFHRLRPDCDAASWTTEDASKAGAQRRSSSRVAGIVDPHPLLELVTWEWAGKVISLQVVARKSAQRCCARGVLDPLGHHP